MAIPVGLIAAGLVAYWFVAAVHPLGVPSRITRWFHCGGGSQGQPSWSPDGRWIAYARRGNCGTQIALITLTGTHARTLTRGRSDTSPVWSPNGKQILYEGAGGLKIVLRKTGATRPVEGSYSDYGADWSPSGRSIVFTHGIADSPFAMTDGTSTIYTLRLASGTPTRLVGHSVDGGTPSWSPDGRWIATAGGDGIYLIDARTGRAHRILKSDAVFQIPVAWSHDGRRIAFASADGVHIITQTGSNPRRVTRCECNGYSDSVSWSPDNTRLVFSQTNDKASDGLYIVNANGSNLHRIVRY